nr:MAG TPA: hypothetical protein [Caudoviricetes sp.]
MFSCTFLFLLQFFEKRKSEPITYCYATDPLGMLWIKLSNIFFCFYFSNIIPLLYIFFNSLKLFYISFFLKEY